MMIPMAISLGFGVLFSTAIILVMVPALYMVLDDVSRLMYKPDVPEAGMLSTPQEFQENRKKLPVTEN